MSNLFTGTQPIRKQLWIEMWETALSYKIFVILRSLVTGLWWYLMCGRIFLIGGCLFVIISRLLLLVLSIFLLPNWLAYSVVRREGISKIRAVVQSSHFVDLFTRSVRKKSHYTYEEQLKLRLKETSRRKTVLSRFFNGFPVRKSG